MGRKTEGAKAQRQKTSFRKNILRFAFIGILVASGMWVWGSWEWILKTAGMRTTHKNNLFLTEARLDHAKRQLYLDDLLKDIAIPYCSGVYYDHDGSKIIDYLRSQGSLLKQHEAEITQIIGMYQKEFRNGQYDVKTPEIFKLAGRNRSTPIFVGRKIFEEYRDWIDEDIKHSIVAHEARHVYQHAKGFNDISMAKIRQWVEAKETRYDVAYNYFELDANIVGLKRIFSGEFHVSNSYLKEVQKSLFINYGILADSLEGASDFHRDIVESILKRVDEDSHLKEILFYFMSHPEMLGN